MDLALEPAALNVTVCDDGVGFDPAALPTVDSPPGGMGLLSMRERVELLGGRFQLQSTLGGGTAFRVRLPM